MGHTLVTGLSADCGLSYQPLHPQSSQRKGKERKDFFLEDIFATISVTYPEN